MLLAKGFPGLSYGHTNQTRMLTDRQNLNQSQNDQKVPLTTFTTIHHSHTQISQHINIAISQPMDFFFLHYKSCCWMGPHFTCKQWTHKYQNSSKWTLCSRESAGAEFPVMSELQLCKNYRHVQAFDTVFINV